MLSLKNANFICSNKHFVLILCLFLSSITFGQNQTELSNDTYIDGDSLDKVYHFYSLANNFKDTNLDLAIFYNKKALTLANKIKSPEACAVTNELMGELFKKNNSLQPSINYYLISARIYENNNDPIKLAGVYSKLGELYYGDGFNLEKAHLYYNKALGLAIETNNKNLIAEVYNRIAGVFHNQQNFDESMDYYLKAYDLWKSIENKEGIAKALNNIGEIYREKNNLKKSLEYYERSLEINKSISSYRQIAVNLENIGMIKSAEGKTSDAFRYYDESLKLYAENNLATDELQILILIGEEYLKINRVDKAYQYFNDAYQSSLEYNNASTTSEAALGLSSALELLNDHENSLKFFKIHSQIKDSVVSRQKIDQLAIMQANFLNDINIKEIELNKNEIALLEKEKRINTINIRFMLFSVFVIIGIAILLHLRQRLKAKKEREIRSKDIEIHKAKNELMEIQLKNKDSDLINFALHLIQKNKVLQELKTELKIISNNTEPENAKKLKELSYQIQQSLEVQKEMEEFQKKVDQTYSDFFNNLREKHPGLTKNEERLCALLRLNLSSKEIASLNNISVKAVEMGRYRLRKKFEIDNHQLLPEFLNNI